ncbi:E3 SUMO-protein ligase PIAS1, partial [Stegodyphus mimosarum]
MSNSDLELQKMVRGFRVSDLQSLLSYAGRNKGGKKYDLQNRALDLIKLHSASIDMKIRELHMNRYQQSRALPEPQDIYPLATINEPMGSNYGNTSDHRGSLNSAIPGYMQNMSKHMLPPNAGLNVMSPYPVYPEVKFKELPFYDVLAELLRPTSLVPLQNERFQERDFVFYFTRQQLNDLQNCDVQVQLRVCLLDTSCDQDDEIPTSVCIKVNKNVVNLPNPIPTNKPGVEPKRPKRPVDITLFIKKSVSEPNEVHISWGINCGRAYVVGIFLVQKQTSSVLIKRLKSNGVRNPDHTTAMIKEKLCQDRDAEIATMSLRGSLICPLGKIKMKLPCRALTCAHLQCFDATLYLQMNERKPKWICPVCDKPALFKNLAIDGLFLDITQRAPSECTEVQFHEDGSWTPVIPVKKAPPEISEASFEAAKVVKKEAPKPKKPVEVISLESDSDTEDSWIDVPKKKPCKPVGIISPSLLPMYSPLSSTTVQDTVTKSIDALASCSSKSDLTDSSAVAAVSEKATPVAQPLIESDVSCITPQTLVDLPGSPSYQDVTSPASPIQPYCPPPSTSTFHDQLEILNSPQSSTVHDFRNFDLYSLIQRTQDEPFEIPLEDDAASPEVISID